MKGTNKAHNQQKNDIIKMRVEIKEIERKRKKEKEKINETKSWFFENINKINKLLPNSLRKKRKEPNKIRNKR